MIKTVEEDKKVTTCCGGDPADVDGTDMRCLCCGEVETDIILESEYISMFDE